MIINDLNHIQAAEENVTGGYYFGESSNTRINSRLNIRTNFNSRVRVRGNFAGAEADALATGRNTSTQAVSFTNTVAGVGSESIATSVSATQGARFFKY